MACNLNLESAVRYIHWAPPGDLDGLFQLAKAKVEELKLSVGRRSHATPVDIKGDPSVNTRGIMRFIDECVPVPDQPADNPDDTAEVKTARKKTYDRDVENVKADHGKLVTLFATLANRLQVAGYEPAEPEAAAPPPPVPVPTPDPKPLA